MGKPRANRVAKRRGRAQSHCRSCPSSRRGRSRTASRLRDLARRQAQGVLPRSQPLARRTPRAETKWQSPPTAARRPASSTARRAGSTARSWPSAPRCGGRPTARSSPTTASTRARCRTTIWQLDQTQLARARSTSRRTRRPACPNPVVDLFVYDVASEEDASSVDVRDGKPFDNDVVGHYVYHVAWSPDGKELLFNRTNRRQNIMEFVAADPDDRQVPRRSSARSGRASWIENRPADAVPQGRQALHLGVGAQRLEELLSLRPDRQAAQRRSRITPFEVGEHRARRRGRRVCSSTWPATATTR